MTSLTQCRGDQPIRELWRRLVLPNSSTTARSFVVKPSYIQQLKGDSASFEHLKAGSRGCPHFLIAQWTFFFKNGRLVKLRLRSRHAHMVGAASEVVKLEISIIDAGRPSLRQRQCLFSITSRYEQNCTLLRYVFDTL
jgi:hypothetical protein